MRPRGLQPTRLLPPGIFQARVLEWGAIAFSVKEQLEQDKTRVLPSTPPGHDEAGRLQERKQPRRWVPEHSCPRGARPHSIGTSVQMLTHTGATHTRSRLPSSSGQRFTPRKLTAANMLGMLPLPGSARRPRELSPRAQMCCCCPHVTDEDTQVKFACLR